MTNTRDERKHTIWYLVIACLIAAALTWFWFSQRIERIDEQIEMHDAR